MKRGPLGWELEEGDPGYAAINGLMEGMTVTKPEKLLDMLHRIDTADPRLEPTREEWARAADSIREMQRFIQEVGGLDNLASWGACELLARLDAWTPKEPGE